MKKRGVLLAVAGIVTVIVSLGAAVAWGTTGADYSDDEMVEMVESGEVYDKYDEGDTFTSDGVISGSSIVDEFNALIEAGKIEGDPVEPGDEVIITWRITNVFDIVADIEDAGIENGSMGGAAKEVREMMEDEDMSEEEMIEYSKEHDLPMTLPWPVKIEKASVGTNMAVCGVGAVGGLVLIVGMVLLFMDRKREREAAAPYGPANAYPPQTYPPQTASGQPAHGPAPYYQSPPPQYPGTPQSQQGPGRLAYRQPPAQGPSQRPPVGPPGHS